MTISNSQQCVNVNELIDSVKILVICPVCSESKKLEFPKSICEATDNLTTISIPKGLICNHSFQAFVDKNYKIRGYQKVDYEFKSPPEESSKLQQDTKKKVKSNKALFENLIAEGNFLEYRPKQLIKRRTTKANPSTKNKKIEKGIDIPSLKQKHPQEKYPNNTIDTKSKGNHKLLSKGNQISLKKTLKEIYNDFWEFIDDDNEFFQKFIILDNR